MHPKPSFTHNSFSKSFMYAVHQLYFLVEKHLERVLKDTKAVSFSQFLVLVCFNECPETNDRSQASISKYLRTTEATVSRHILALEKAGLITKKINKQNRRKFQVTMTAKGLREYKKALAIITHELDTLFDVVRPHDRESIITNCNAVLSKLAVIINK